MKFSLDNQPYASNRYPVVATRGMVNTSCPQASAAGLEILRKGGNAIDAAIAAAAALTVVEPTSNGIGSDAFAIVWYRDKLYGLNGSGRAPRSISIEKVLAAGAPDGRMPMHGWTPVMVSGAPKTWAALSERFGRLPLSEVLKPAVSYAREGYPVSPVVARGWANAFASYSREFAGKPEFDGWFETFAPKGRAPYAGEVITLPDHADTLEKIGATGADAFYKGELTDKIIAECRQYGGYLTPEDYADYDVSWVEPARVGYRGYEVCEIPPNGQGIVALMALNILREFEFTSRADELTFHRQFEAMKLAFADGLHYVTDPSCMALPYERLILPEYGRLRAKEIGEYAKEPVAGTPPKGGTVYFCAADGEGNMISMIQSNYMGFGSGIVVKGTGISLQNRGYDFSLNPSHANALAPGKKTYHTIIPGFLMKDGNAVGPFGVMGAYMQPQGHVQVIMNLLDFGLNPQMALDAPRWQWIKGRQFLVEPSFDSNLARQLAKRGHDVRVALHNETFGRGQMIMRMDNGTLVGGTESRADGSIACW